MILYRGLAIDKTEFPVFQEEIINSGLTEHSEKAFMRMYVDDVRDELLELFDAESQLLIERGPANHEFNMNVDDQGRHLQGFLPVICACGDAEGAKFYAYRAAKNRPDLIPVLLSFNVSEVNLWIDSRDFLCTTFQMGETSKCQSNLPLLFGDSILKYFGKAHASSNQIYRVVMAHLACQDLDVIRAHLSNRLVIGGRSKTRFRSAFFVALPIANNRITSIELLEGHYYAPEIDVDLLSLVDSNQS